MLSATQHREIDRLWLSELTEEVSYVAEEATEDSWTLDEDTFERIPVEGTEAVTETLPAWVDQETAREAIRYGRTNDQTAFVVRIPAGHGVTEDTQLTWRGYSLSVQGIPNDLQNTGRIDELLCTLAD